MALSRFKNKRDANEGAIFATLRAHGLSVHALDTPADCIVGYGGQTWLVEIKGLNGKLTPAQIEFYETWRGNMTILCTEGEAEEFARAVRSGSVEIRGGIS